NSRRIAGFGNLQNAGCAAAGAVRTLGDDADLIFSVGFIVVFTPHVIAAMVVGLDGSGRAGTVTPEDAGCVGLLRKGLQSVGKGGEEPLESRCGEIDLSWAADGKS